MVLYQLSYTRSFERDNNVSLNLNWAFTASYDQTLYEKTIPPLHMLARVVWQLISSGSDRKSDCQPDSSNSRNSGNLNSGVSINTNGSR